MTTLEALPGQEYEEGQTPLQKFVKSVVHFATQNLSFFPGDAPPLMSEHFGHAMKINDLRPDVKNYKT